MADDRKDAEKTVTGLGKAIFKHLVVVLRYKDHTNQAKHLDDINNWLDEVQDIKLRKGKRLKGADYFTWLYEDRDSDLVNLEKYVRRLDRDYGKLPIILDVSSLHGRLLSIYRDLSEQLGSNDFVTVQALLQRR
jgi:hypothetical protein